MNRTSLLVALFLVGGIFLRSAPADAARPNIVLVMADDMGWGQTSYNKHPLLKTPNLDAMAANGLRFDRFYAGAPNCSPTRATVMTGRSNDRTGVADHGYPLRKQEKTLAQAMRDKGYATGHFGKWHLSGYRGPGVPILETDERSPGAFGFTEWLSVTNFFDRDPLLSRRGTIEEFKGDSSEIIVDEALKFIAQQGERRRPFFAVVWYGSPHSPMRADATDKAAFAGLDETSQNHYGELVAMDRSLGTLRAGLRKLGVAENTLVWFCSDNGGLPNIKPDTVGGLRGFKNSLYEGGLRVPGIIEWPAVIKAGRTTSYPAGTVDIFPTIADVVRLSPFTAMLSPIDGLSLQPLFSADLKTRSKPLPFRHLGRAALIDNRYKLIAPNVAGPTLELYDLETDPGETKNLAESQPQITRQLRETMSNWNESVKASSAGKDYPQGRVTPAEPPERDWRTAFEYEPYLAEWQKRPEYREAIQGKKKE